MNLLYIALAFLLGIGGAALLPSPTQCGLPTWTWVVPLLLMPFAPLLNRMQHQSSMPLRWSVEYGFRVPRGVVTPALVGACLLALAAGALRFWSDPLYPCFDEGDLATYNVRAEESFNVKEGWVTLTGAVDSYVAQGGGEQRITVAATHLSKHGAAQEVEGKVTLLADTALNLHYGDAVRVAGVLSTPPEFADFSWRDWLARHDIYSTLNLAQVERLEAPPAGIAVLRTLYALRARGEAVVNQMLPEPYAALANGMLLGIEGNIPDDLYAQFNDTSSSHVIVISGSNIALISGILLAAGSRLGGRRARTLAFWLAVAAIFLYALLVGAEPSVTRAAFMGGLLVIATALGRRSTALVSLGIAALVMTLRDPHILWDVGFQLSAVATLGLILLVPKFRPDAAGGAPEEVASAISPLHGARSFLADTIIVSLAATLAVTPLLVWHFHRLSLIGLLTNLLIVPIQPLILVSGLAGLSAGLAGLLLPARVAFGVTGLGLAWTVEAVERSAAVQWANWAVGGWGAAAIIALCVGAVAFVWQHAPARGVANNETGAQASGESGAVENGHWRLPGWQTVVTSRLFLGALAVALVLVLLGVVALPDGKTHLWFLPSERGQAVLIQSPSGRQILVDGGDDSTRLLSGLAGAMGFWDREIDRLILTSADARTMQTQSELARRLHVDSALTTRPLEDGVGLWARTLEGEAVHVQQTPSGSRLVLEDGVTITLHAAGKDVDDPAVVEVDAGNLRVLLPASADASLAGMGAATVVSIPDLGKGSADDLLANTPAPYAVVYGDETIAGETMPLYPNLDGTIHLWSDGQQLWVE